VTLKIGIWLHSCESFSKVWKTCSIFHNWLLEVGVLNKRWGHSLPTDRKGQLGHHDAEVMDQKILLILNCVNSGKIAVITQ
jgi:hypothetical protein